MNQSHGIKQKNTFGICSSYYESKINSKEEQEEEEEICNLSYFAKKKKQHLSDSYWFVILK